MDLGLFRCCSHVASSIEGDERPSIPQILNVILAGPLNSYSVAPRNASTQFHSQGLGGPRATTEDTWSQIPQRRIELQIPDDWKSKSNYPARSASPSLYIHIHYSFLHTTLSLVYPYVSLCSCLSLVYATLKGGRKHGKTSLVLHTNRMAHTKDTYEYLLVERSQKLTSQFDFFRL